MPRWHQPSCINPNIVVNGNIPHCLACNTSPSLQDLTDSQAPSNALNIVPPNELPDQLRLWWPPCVPYQPHLDSSDGDQEMKAPVKDNIQSRADIKNKAKSLESPATVSSSDLYCYQLGLNEFRLICLSAAVDQNYPIHVELETYQHDNSPEYETVSYTWGGEDNDYSLYRPIYVGLYWDVLLQTRNCWSMLHYFRPRRGIRFIWVDAICIDQSNPIERELQVAKMGSIYQQCTRVLVYLGENFVRTNSRQYPPRHYLDEFPAGHDFPELDSSNDTKNNQSSNSLNILFQLRYFSRLWVIQELVLAPSAVIPVGYAEFRVNNLSVLSMMDMETGGLKPKHKGDEHPAPWVQYITSGREVLKSTPVDILRQTWKSQAKDPRDKLFGILGLLQEVDWRIKSQESSIIRPDYSISLFHMWIGYFSQLLINYGHTEILTNAVGLAASPPYPSWMPSYQDAFILPREPTQNVINTPYSLLQLEYSQGELLEVRMNKSQPWCASIESSTGALCATLCHILEFPCNAFEMREKRPRETVFQIRMMNWALFIHTSFPLETYITPEMSGSLELFTANLNYIPGHDLGHPLLLFMQRVDPKENTYRLVASFLSWNFTFYLAGPAKPFNGKIEAEMASKRPKHGDPWWKHGRDALGWDGTYRRVQIL